MTRAPESRSEQDTFTISGFVEDDTSLRHIMLFHNEDKVFFEGAATSGMAHLPFTVDIELDEGVNTVTVLARDADGLTSSHSIVTLKAPSGD